MITARVLLLIALLGLCSALPATAVQLPLNALTVSAPLSIPPSRSRAPNVVRGYRVIFAWRVSRTKGPGCSAANSAPFCA